MPFDAALTKKSANWASTATGGGVKGRERRGGAEVELTAELTL